MNHKSWVRYRHPARWTGIFWLFVLMLTFSNPSWAHKLSIFAYVEGDRVYIESYFANGDPCANSPVRVYDRSGAILVEGQTDGEGMFNFQLPERDDLRIVVEASMGHRNEYLLSKQEIVGEMGSASSPPITSPEDAQETTRLPAARDIEQILDRKLAPLIANVHEMQRAQDRAKLRDIIGGIGYIVGLMGLVMYLRARKRDD